MAPFDNPYSSNLTNKISPLLEGQLPDFIQSDHKVFARFLKHYYQYLEAGELQVTVSIDNLLLELETTSHVLDTDGEKLVLENGTSETTGKFIVGETITGATSKATATVLVDDLGHLTKPRMFITGQQQFQTGETITGGTSNATGTVVRYRANPVQNIQQLLEYANVDNTIYDFLDQLRESFMNAIPSELATGVNKRNLIKNIRELYRAKGTSEGHKIFMRMLLDENIDIVYPNKFMMRASDGKWSNQTILRCSPGVNAAADEMLGVVVTGQSSDATAVIANALSTAEGGDPIVIFEINPASLVGTFTDGEIIQGTSTVQDVTMSFTVRGMVTDYTVTDGGKLYSVGDDLDLDTQTAIGNGQATAEVASIKRGSVSRVIVDDAGTLFREGDVLTFTSTETGTNTKAATGFVSVIDGSLEIDGTDSSSSNAGDNLVLEAGSTSSIVNSNFLLDGTDSSGSNAGDRLALDRTNSSSHNAGHFLINETDEITLDSHGTDNDTFALEDGTAPTGEITRVFLKDGGGGYSSLPSIAITSTSGTGAVLLSDTNNIGTVDEVNISKQGFKYTEAPEGQFRANFILKDVTGTFSETNTLSSSGHTGVVKSFNSTTKVLKTTFEDVQRITMETGASEGIELENNLVVATDKDGRGDFLANNHLATGDKLVDQDGNNIVMDSPFEGKQLDYFVIESGTELNGSDGFLVEEDSRIGFDSGVALESVSGGKNIGDTIDPTGGRGLYDNLVYEDSIRGVIGYEDATSTNDAHYFNPSSTQTRFVTEDSLSVATRDGAGSNILLNGDIEFGDQNEIKILLDGTDASQTNAGDNLVTEASDTNSNRIVLDCSSFAAVTVNGAVSKSNRIIVDGVSGTIAIGMVVTVTSGATSITDGSGSNSISTNGTLRVVSVASQTDFRVSESITVANDVTLSLKTDEGDVLLNDIETAAGNIALNGTNSTSNNAGDNIVNEQPPDFSSETVTITDSSGASGTIVSIDIAKGTTSIGTKTETVPSYGVSIESLIGESLNRIQDSVYYQQFSYEIEAASSSADYATELKKAVHPAGFNLFGKVSIATQVSVALPTAGSSLGGGYTSDTDTFSPILASTFNIVFQENIQRRMGVLEYDVASFDDELLLESDETNIGGELLLDGTDSSSTNAGGKFISETLPNHFIDFEGISLEDITNGRGSGDVGALVDETTGDRIISESAVALSFNMLLEPESTINGGDFLPGFSGTDSNILLDGTDSSGTNAGDKFEFEIGNNESSFFTISIDTVRNTDTILSDAGGSIHLETSGKGDQANKEISFVSIVTTKVMLPRKQTSSLPSGLITMATQLFGSKSASVSLELGVVGGSGSGHLLLTNHNQVNLIGGVDTTSSDGEEIVFEDAVDDNIGTGFTFSDFGKYTFNTMVLDGTDSSGSNAGDNIISESSTALITYNILLDSTGLGGAEIVLEAGTDTSTGSILMENDNGNPFSVNNNSEGSYILGETASLQNTNGTSPSNHNYNYVSIEDITGQQIFMGDIDSGDEVNIILEHFGGSGSESTAATDGQADHGSILLEDSLLVNSKGNILNETAGVSNTISLESNPDFLIPEDEVKSNPTHGFANSISIPEENYTTTTSPIEPYSYSSDIITRPMGILSLEEESREVTNIQLESGTEGGIFGNLLNDATGTDPNGITINENSTIALEDFHDVRNLMHGGNTIILDRIATSGNFTSVGDDIILETATYYDNLLNTDKIAVPLTFENAFDSTSKTFDSSLLTWDSTI